MRLMRVSPIATPRLCVMAARDVRPGRHLAPLERGACSTILVTVPMTMAVTVTVPMTMAVAVPMTVSMTMAVTMTGL